ncbi:protein FAM210B, mitochondrial-like isoform X2 [Homalodisca vitripennis]|nr:protein FAM210B, mitochondrial-like isoform X2 [Homalodisca vitripennis]XP_046675599.1 protein FAM210B, mitochondrial-like isoform X2 [Homalodisca vitripennis]
MYLWAPKGRLLCQVAQKCLCQESFTYARHTVTTLSHNRRLFPNSLLVYSSKPSTVYGAPVSRTPVLYGRLTAMSEEMQTFSTSSGDPETPKLSNRAKLKRAVKDYGATVIIFHVTISLMSLGISYLAISSGLDVASLLEKVGLDPKSEIAAGASTFVVAYAVHKVFAPVRISITLASTPFIVRYLRRVGILKPPKPTGT